MSVYKAMVTRYPKGRASVRLLSTDGTTTPHIQFERVKSISHRELVTRALKHEGLPPSWDLTYEYGVIDEVIA